MKRMTQKTTGGEDKVQSLDAVIVGAGFAGLYMLHRLRKLGFSARIYEAGAGVGGTWFGTATPARAATSKVWSTHIPSPKSCSGSGGGRNATLPNQRSFGISTT